MYEIINATTASRYGEQKKVLRFESVPNTAVGYDSCRKNIVDTRYGNMWFLSANSEKRFFVNNEKDDFSLWFFVDGDKITIERAVYHGRTEESARLLKKYAMVVCMMHSCIKYDQVVQYKKRR